MMHHLYKIYLIADIHQQTRTLSEIRTWFRLKPAYFLHEGPLS